MSTRMSAGRIRATYEFIKAQSATFSVQTLCRVLDVGPSGYYAWLKQPVSNHASEDARLLRLIYLNTTSRRLRMALLRIEQSRADAESLANSCKNQPESSPQTDDATASRPPSKSLVS